MDTPTISSVDADGNVVIATTSTTTISELTSEKAATDIQLTQIDSELSDEEAFVSKLQTQENALKATDAEEEALIEAATPLLAAAQGNQVAPAQDIPLS